MMGDCKYENYKYDYGYIYDDGNYDYIPNHYYRVKEGGIAVTVTGEYKSSARDYGSKGHISGGGKYITYDDDNDDDENIEKSDVSPLVLPHGAATGPSPGRLTDNLSPDI